MKFGTKVIHAGIEPDPATGAIMTPIYQTSTYVQESPGVHKGFAYARSQNPTRSVLEKNLASLENGMDAICFGSGLAATDAVLKLLSPGDEVVAANDLYGGTYRIMTRVYTQNGINFKFVGLDSAESILQPGCKTSTKTLQKLASIISCERRPAPVFHFLCLN